MLTIEQHSLVGVILNILQYRLKEAGVTEEAVQLRSNIELITRLFHREDIEISPQQRTIILKVLGHMIVGALAAGNQINCTAEQLVTLVNSNHLHAPQYAKRYVEFYTSVSLHAPTKD